MRNFLYIGGVRDPEQDKRAGSTVRIDGFKVFQARLLRVLLNLGPQNTVYLMDDGLSYPPESGAPLLSQRTSNVRWVSTYDLRCLQRVDDLILISSSPELQYLAWLREIIQTNAPVIGFAHTVLSHFWTRWFTNSMGAYLQPYDSMVCSTMAAKKAFENIFESLPSESKPWPRIPFRMPVIPLGIDLCEFSRSDRSAARTDLCISSTTTALLFLGRISANSKCDLVPLLLAFARLVASNRDICLIIAGDSTEDSNWPRIESIIDELNLKAFVRMMKNVPSDLKLRLYCAADIFVSPSDNLQESFGITIIEAMAAGLPVVASDWNGYKELVVHNKTGFLVPTYLPRLEGLHAMRLQIASGTEALVAIGTSVDVEALLRYLQTLLDDPKQRREMGMLGRRLALERFDWGRIIRCYEKLFAEALECKAHTRVQPMPSLQRLDVQKFFAHYPTRTILSTDRVVLNSAISDEQLDLHLRLANEDINLPAKLLEQIVDILRCEGISCEADLRSQLAKKFDESQLILSIAIGRLLKYDVIRLSEDAH